jgi:AcrR family transcriptional regulator
MIKRSETKSKGAGPKQPTDRFAAYLDLGRANQKMRTRDALITVAAELIRTGQEISVSEVADAARVSRTTAYRYFPTSEMLAAQATFAAANVVESRQLDKIAQGPGSPEEKLDAIISGSHAMTTAHEAAFRSMLRFTVNDRTKNGSPSRRPTFRRTWVEGALSSLKKTLGRERFVRLTCALCVLCGIEPLIVLNDICQLAPEEAREVKRWAAQQLLRAAISEAEESRPGSTKSRQSPKS